MPRSGSSGYAAQPASTCSTVSSSESWKDSSGLCTSPNSRRDVPPTHSSNHTRCIHVTCLSSLSNVVTDETRRRRACSSVRQSRVASRALRTPRRTRRTGYARRPAARRTSPSESPFTPKAGGPQQLARAAHGDVDEPRAAVAAPDHSDSRPRRGLAGRRTPRASGRAMLVHLTVGDHSHR